jgi:hypothetical protein
MILHPHCTGMSDAPGASGRIRSDRMVDTLEQLERLLVEGR